MMGLRVGRERRDNLNHAIKKRNLFPCCNLPWPIHYLRLKPLLGVEPRHAVLEAVVSGGHQRPDRHDRSLGLDLHRDDDVALLVRGGGGSSRGGRKLKPESGLVGL